MLRAALRPPARESAVRAGSFNLMRAFAGSPLYTSSIKNYVETACSKKENSSSSALVLTVGAAVFVLAVIVGIVMFRAGEKPQAGSDIPLDILAANASQLSNNNYALDGTVIDRFPRGESELIAFLYKDASGRECIIPVCVSAEARNGLNINRDQQYRIEFRVEDVNPKVRGVCVATSIQPK